MRYGVIRHALASLAVAVALPLPASAREIAPEDWVASGSEPNAKPERLSVGVPNTITAHVQTRLLREVTVRFAEGCALSGELLLDGSPIRSFAIPEKGRKVGLSAKAGVGTHAIGLRLEPEDGCARGRAVVETASFREWIPIGSEAGERHLRDRPYADLLARHVDSVTAGTDMQWNAIEPAPGVFDFAGADAVVAFAEAHDIPVRGHPLLWHANVPRYARQDSNGPAETAAILERHVSSVVGKYRGVVDEWDVVNEPVSDGGGLRDTWWRKDLGRNYIALAFLHASRADPDARLFLNEHSAEVVNGKSDTMLRIVEALLDAGIRIDGVGFQYHASTEGWPDRDKMVENFRRFADLGLAIQITEADVTDDTGDPDSAFRRSLQADAFAAGARACKKVVACERYTMWGLSDRYSWLGAGLRPLPFDQDLRAKPAWTTLKSILRPKG
jgi:endo-1,4-beta-xylanase